MCVGWFGALPNAGYPRWAWHGAPTKRGLQDDGTSFLWAFMVRMAGEMGQGLLAGSMAGSCKCDHHSCLSRRMPRCAGAPSVRSSAVGVNSQLFDEKLQHVRYPFIPVMLLLLYGITSIPHINWVAHVAVGPSLYVVLAACSSTFQE